jgi:hypothetical protein
MQPCPANDQLMDDILSDVEVPEIEARLRELSPECRRELLCAICEMHSEIAVNCRQRALVVSSLLTAQCLLFVDGHATCVSDTAM